MDSYLDPLGALAPPDVQRQAARLAQDAFAQAFKHTIESTAEERQKSVAALSLGLLKWAQEAPTPEAGALRRAFILSGLDQWGLAYSQTFGPHALIGLTELVNVIRANLTKDGDEARVLAFFEQINAEQEPGFDFKAELRRAIHMALWHSMIAEEDRDSALDILRHVGGMMLRLLTAMPDLGWIVVANTLADIQIRCLAHGLAKEGLGQEMTQELFGALAQQMPQDQREKVMSAATRAVLTWQQSLKTKQ